jgi:hypothetical protein
MPAYDFHVVAYEGWKVDATRSASGIPITTYTYAGAERSQHAVYGDLPKALDFYESKFGKYRWGSASFIRAHARLGRRRRRRADARHADLRSVRRPRLQDRFPLPGRNRLGVRTALTCAAAVLRDVRRHERAPSTRPQLHVAADGIRATIRRP